MHHCFLPILLVIALTGCTVSHPSPSVTATLEVPTSLPTATLTPAPTPTPTPEWGIAFAVLTIEPSAGSMPMRLYTIRRDGNELTPLSGDIEHITHLAASPDGRYLLFMANHEDTTGDNQVGYFDLSHLYMVEVQTGKMFTLTSGTTTLEWSATWSPDEEQIAFVSSEVNTPCYPCPPCYEELCTPMVTEFHTHLYVMNRDGTGKRRLTPQEGRIETVVWSPTGEWIAFEQHSAVWIVKPNGSELRKVADTPIEYHWRPYTAQPAWSPDGRHIAFVAPGVGEEKNADIFIINADGSGLFNVTQHPDEDYQPAWSPDGQWIAFKSKGVYAISVDGKELRSFFTRGAKFPVWSPDGSLIAFVATGPGMWEDQVFVVDWGSGGSPRLLSKEYMGDRPAWVRLFSR